MCQYPATDGLHWLRIIPNCMDSRVFHLLQGMKMKKHEELETPTFTTSIPVSIATED